MIDQVKEENQVNKLLYSALALVIGVILYRYRYNIINIVLRARPLQQLLVRFAMNIPFVRQAIISQVFR
jgi:hypothetical protein